MKRKKSTEKNKSSSTSTTTLSTILSDTETVISNLGSQFNLFMMIEMHDDVFKKILSCLSINDLNLQRLVRNRFKQAADFVFEFFHLPNIPNLFSFKDNNALPNQKVIEFRSECEQITKLYTEKLVQTMGVEKIACLPKTNLLTEAMGRNQTTIHLYAKANASEKTVLLSEKINFFTIANQFENKESQVLKKLCIFESTGKIFPKFFSKNQYDYLGRLMNNQPCGKIVDDVETEPKITEKNQPFVQLCDENGEVLDFSARNTGLKF